MRTCTPRRSHIRGKRLATPLLVLACPALRITQPGKKKYAISPCLPLSLFRRLVLETSRYRKASLNSVPAPMSRSFSITRNGRIASRSGLSPLAEPPSPRRNLPPSWKTAAIVTHVGGANPAGAGGRRPQRHIPCTGGARGRANGGGAIL